MLSKQQLQHHDDFWQESKLKQIANRDNVSIVYIHGTARSGSTIAEIVLTQLADLAVHQPFRGTLQKRGGRFRTQNLDDDADIYDLGCGLICQQIEQCLQVKDRVTVVIKELAGFFKIPIWNRWLEIPDKFLFTVREPHLQYMSWLSAMTDKVFQGGGTLQKNKNFVLERAEDVEVAPLSAEWQGTTLSCNQNAWNALSENFNLTKKYIKNNNKKLTILDSVLLRYNPEVAIKNAIALLGFTSEKLSLLDLKGLAKTESKVWDIRDKNRPMVRKANSSNSINPITVGEAVNLDIFPLASQEHIKRLIPSYLDLLYTKEQAYIPSIDELSKNSETGLAVAHPFMAYAIAFSHLKEKQKTNDWFEALARKESLNIDEFKNSFAVVDRYWNKA